MELGGLLRDGKAVWIQRARDLFSGIEGREFGQKMMIPLSLSLSLSLPPLLLLFLLVGIINRAPSLSPSSLIPHRPRSNPLLPPSLIRFSFGFDALLSNPQPARLIYTH